MPLFLWSENVKLKLDEQGNAVLQDGKPVYVHDDGKEVPFDAPGAMAKIASLNAEAKTHREAKEAAEAKLKAFDGIEDAEAAKKALATVKNLDDKKLVDAGEVEKLKAEAGGRPLRHAHCRPGKRRMQPQAAGLQGALRRNRRAALRRLGGGG